MSEIPSSNENSSLEMTYKNMLLNKTQKIISSFFIEKENEKIIIALDLEGYLYIWYLKISVIEALSFLDDLENEEKKNLFPDLCFRLHNFISIINNFPATKKIEITNFNYLPNSDRKYFHIIGNFDSIIITYDKFMEYIDKEIQTNIKNFNKYENLIDLSLTMQENYDFSGINYYIRSIYILLL